MRTSNSSITSQDARDLWSGGPTKNGNFLVLEICRGKTEHPLRPVNLPRFLIGSSPHCDLRLGGVDIPALHAILVVENDEIWIDAFGLAPALSINGRVVTSARIVDGDHLRIGAFELLAHVSAPAVAQPAKPDHSLADSHQAATPIMELDDEEIPATELSAAELIDRIETATELVNEFERRQRLGVEALFEAVAQRQDAVPAPRGEVLPMADPSESPASEALLNLELLVEEISGIIAELEQRSGIARPRSISQLDAASALFDAQDRLSRQVAVLLRRVAVLNAQRSNREPGRAIA